MPRVRRREAVLWSVRSEERSVMNAVDRVGGAGTRKGRKRKGWRRRCRKERREARGGRDSGVIVCLQLGDKKRVIGR